MTIHRQGPASEAWFYNLKHILSDGKPSSPRGKATIEILQQTVIVNMRRPVVVIPERKLNYQFMAAEAYWILSGDDTVEGIAPWNKNISKFSDDGIVFAGAYGPMIKNQIGYVTDKLIEDRDSRQAGLTIWRPNPNPSKDIPCTVSAFFSIRGDKLNVHIFMRSNDIWLGTPYDVFNFSMLGHYVCARLNTHYKGNTSVSPGVLYHTAASLHLYQENIDAALDLINAQQDRYGAEFETNETPEALFKDPFLLLAGLYNLRDTKPGDPLRWWEAKE